MPSHHRILRLINLVAHAMIFLKGDNMSQSDTMNEEIAVFIEQYADHAEARLPGQNHEWEVVGSTPDEAINQLMVRLHGYPTHTFSAAVPVAVSLLNVARNTLELRPPMVVYAPDAVMALFSGNLDLIEPPPPDAIWLKPGETIPDHAPAGSAFVIPGRIPPFHADRVLIRSHSEGHRLLHHTDGGVLLSPAEQTVSRVYQQRETDEMSTHKPTAPALGPEDRFAVVVEQYRDHAEAYLPGMGDAWHTSDVTPDKALEYLLQLIHRHRLAIPSRMAPVAVSLLTVHPNATNLHPATVEQAPAGVMVLFWGRLLPGEEVPPNVHHLPQGKPIPDDAPRGHVFLVPPITEGLDHGRHCPTAAVVIRAHLGEDHHILHHQGPVVVKFPARLVRSEYGPWGEPRHDEHPVK